MIIQELHISVPGRVFIRQLDALDGNPPAVIRFSGNADEVFQYLEVIPIKHSIGAIQVRVRPHIHGYIPSPYLLTEIILNRNQRINKFAISGTADVIVEEGISSFTVNVQVSGSGNIYFTHTPSLVLDTLTTSILGSANVYYSFQSNLVLDTLTNGIAGSGSINIAVSGNLSTNSLNAGLAGSSSLCLKASTSYSQNINAGIAGSGTITMKSKSNHGQCTQATVDIFGSGAVYIGSIQCEDVMLGLMGSSSEVVVQATHSIIGTESGSSQVHFIGAPPSKISDRTDKKAFTTADNPKYRPIAVPMTDEVATLAHDCLDWSIPSREAVAIPSKFGDHQTFPLVGLMVLALIAWCYLRRQNRSSRMYRGWYSNHPNELQALHITPSHQSQ